MTTLDHLFVFLLLIVVPSLSVVSFRRLQRRAANGEIINRAELYLQTALGQWLLLVIALAGWAGASRPWSTIGFVMNYDLRFVLGAILTLIAIGFLVFQIRKVMTANDTELVKVKRSFETVSLLLPRNGNELARFYGLSVTAGIVEEILWRGFLIWYLGQFMPLWAAAVVGAIGFGVAHAYQGWSQVTPVILVGAAFGGLYLLTGSLLLPIILHAAVDILQGRLAYEVNRRSHFDNHDVAALAAT
jgi:membrane protease YdiL (CAAX protease family)